jgi:hypothetical protein
MLNSDMLPLSEQQRFELYGGHPGHFESDHQMEDEWKRTRHSLRQERFFSKFSPDLQQSYVQRHYPNIQLEQERLQANEHQLHENFLAASRRHHGETSETQSHPEIEKIQQEMERLVLHQRAQQRQFTRMQLPDKGHVYNEEHHHGKDVNRDAIPGPQSKPSRKGQRQREGKGIDKDKGENSVRTP